MMYSTTLSALVVAMQIGHYPSNPAAMAGMGKMPRPLDLTGLLIETAMALAARHFLCGNVVPLVQIASALSCDGFGGDEINIVLGRERVELEAWRVASLAELRSWLERGGAHLN